MNLPKWQSHKIIEAGLIFGILNRSNGSASLSLDLSPVQEAGVVEVSAEYVQKHNPQVGGYYVRYPDGYESWSPAASFEEGYTPYSGGSEAVMPQPSIGRIVHFRDDPYPGEAENWCAALIIAVHGPECVNLKVTDPHGAETIRTSVMMGDGLHEWRWPPRV